MSWNLSTGFFLQYFGNLDLVWCVFLEKYLTYYHFLPKSLSKCDIIYFFENGRFRYIYIGTNFFKTQTVALRVTITLMLTLWFWLCTTWDGSTGWTVKKIVTTYLLRGSIRSEAYFGKCLNFVQANVYSPSCIPCYLVLIV